MTPLCRHYECLCLRAAELAAIADKTGETRWLAEAVELHRDQSKSVRCRITEEIAKQ